MSEIRSLTVSRELIDRLKGIICCSGSKAICRDDKFCSGDSVLWPIVQDGDGRTRLTYPEDKDKPSIPGVPEFCSAYLSWYTKAGCGALAGETANVLAQAGRCPVAVDPKELATRIAAGVNAKQRIECSKRIESGIEQVVEPYTKQCDNVTRDVGRLQAMLLDRCDIMFDRDAAGGQTFNVDRAEDLQNVATFCQGVQDEESRRSSGNPYAKGGGAAALLLIVAKVARVAINTLRKARNGTEAFGKDLDGLSRAVKHLFTKSIPNFLKIAKYVITFQWLWRGPPGPPTGGAGGPGRGPGAGRSRARTPSADKVRAVPKRGAPPDTTKRFSAPEETEPWWKLRLELPSLPILRPEDIPRLVFFTGAAMLAYQMAQQAAARAAPVLARAAPVAVRFGAAAARAGGVGLRFLGALDMAVGATFMLIIPASSLQNGSMMPNGAPPEMI